MRKKTVEKLRRVRDAILRSPERVDMDAFFETDVYIATNGHMHSCGTAGCIAGWTLSLEAGHDAPDAHDETSEPAISAADALGLSTEQQKRLFYLSGWPSEFVDKLWDAKLYTKEYGEIVAERIDHFIATDGGE